MADDYSEYKAHVDMTLKAALDEFKILLIDIDNLQTGVTKQYLWLNALLTGGIFSIFSTWMPHFAGITLLEAIYSSLFVSAALFSIAGFISAITLLAGTSQDAAAKTYSQKLIDAYGTNDSYKTLVTKQTWVNELDVINANAKEGYTKTALKLRCINKTTVAAAIIAASGAAFLLLNQLFLTP